MDGKNDRKWTVDSAVYDLFQDFGRLSPSEEHLVTCMCYLIGALSMRPDVFDYHMDYLAEKIKDYPVGDKPASE